MTVVHTTTRPGVLGGNGPNIKEYPVSRPSSMTEVSQGAMRAPYATTAQLAAHCTWACPARAAERDPAANHLDRQPGSTRQSHAGWLPLLRREGLGCSVAVAEGLWSVREFYPGVSGVTRALQPALAYRKSVALAGWGGPVEEAVQIGGGKLRIA
ncbi:hypothetical protein GQ53DRAFT_756615 [Thozetella sp. PMI_491]|nr:hypothetical protein GQ53DRAFT_756615 [Thozetella sp. PMI_491]